MIDFLIAFESIVKFMKEREKKSVIAKQIFP